MKKWRAIFETATGRLTSVGSVYPETLAEGLDYIELDEQPDLPAVMWDEALRQFVARPKADEVGEV